MTPEEEARLGRAMQAAFDKIPIERIEEQERARIEAEARGYPRFLAGLVLLSLTLIGSLIFTMISIGKWIAQ